MARFIVVAQETPEHFIDRYLVVETNGPHGSIWCTSTSEHSAERIADALNDRFVPLNVAEKALRELHMLVESELEPKTDPGHPHPWASYHTSPEAAELAERLQREHEAPF